MKIVILGAGQVGASVAGNLASEANDITVIDDNAAVLHDLQDRLDIRTIVGHASHPETLMQAGADDADMIIAVTRSDETNMIACQIAYTLFRTPTKIARVRSVEYLKHNRLFAQAALPVDVIISPEQLVTDYIERLIEYPGALQVLDFADGRVQLVAVRALRGGPLVGHELRDIRQHMPGVDARVAAIFRRGRAISPEGNTVVETDDEVFFLAARKHIHTMISELRKRDNPVRRIMIAGGGNIGIRLAAALEGRYRVTIIEHNSTRIKLLSEQLKHATVQQGDAADEDLLRDEGIENTDVFCALTNDEEANILSAMLAKRLGASKVMSLINRASYVNLVQSDAIDVAISPQQATIGSLLTHVRRGDVVMVHSLRKGAAEAIEAVAHGNHTSSRVVGRPIGEIRLPAGTMIGAVVRGEEVIIAHHDTVIETDDHVILFLSDKKSIAQVEKLFQVGVSFF